MPSKPVEGSPKRQFNARNSTHGIAVETARSYTGFHDDSHFSEEGHYGVPDIYEDGGDGTGGAFDILMSDEDDDGKDY